MKTCPVCEGTSFDYLSPKDLEENWNVSVDETIVVCNGCNHDITESLQIQDTIQDIEFYLNLYPVFQDKYTELTFFLQ